MILKLNELRDAGWMLDRKKCRRYLEHRLSANE